MLTRSVSSNLALRQPDHEEQPDLKASYMQCLRNAQPETAPLPALFQARHAARCREFLKLQGIVAGNHSLG